MQNNRSRLRRLALTHVAAFAFLLLGHAVARAVPVVGLTTENELVMFDSNAPGHVFHRVAVNNLAETGEVLIGIDYRPSNGRVYGLSDRSRVYIVDVATGRVVALGGRFSPPLQDIGPQTGREVGFDIDPVQDRARVVGCSVNYQLALDTGGVIAAHNALTFAPGQPRAGQRACASGAAYSNNFRGATSTTLYAIDSSADELMTVGSVGGSPSSPNSGQVFVIGKLFGPHPATEFAAFDIAPGTASLAFVALTGADAVATRLGTVNLSTGRADIIDHIGGQQGSAFVYLRGMAVLPADADLYGVTVTNKLLRFNAAAPGVIVSSKQITGLLPNEQIVGIDFGHAVGPASLGVSEPQLYALGSSGAVYVINPATGTPSRFLSVRMPPLEGTSFGFEFMGGFFRITSDTGQNMTVSEFTPPNVHAPPAYAGDDANAGKTPKVVGLGFRQSPPPGGATAGTLYGIDSAQNTLVTFNPEPATLRTVGSLSLFLTGNVAGFDIPTGSDTGFAAVSPLCFEGCPTPSTLVRVSLQFGQASVAGGIGGGEQVRALAAAPAF
ncbi:MAG TPA: DUF4394 domain-containing protein, partial [Pyrinomonadaceae bacterium]|nr:DUF4394 domain-containing protein [Pyrinomonadaceae bacterium]